MKKLSLGKQAEIIKATIPQPFSLEFEGQKIEVNPVLSLGQKQEFTDIVWGLYYAADKDKNFDFRPYTFDFAIRLATLYCYTNVAIDLAEKVDKYYELAQYSGIYEKICESFSGVIERDHKALVDSAKEYIERRCNELDGIRAFAAKNQIDILIEDVLSKASDMLDSFRSENGQVDLNQLFAAVREVKSLANQDNLVGKILDFRFGKKVGETDQDERGAEVAGVPELGGGDTED